MRVEAFDIRCPKYSCFWKGLAPGLLSLLGHRDPLVGPKWPSADHGRSSTEADIDRPAKKEWQPPVKRPRKNCWSANIVYGGMPYGQQRHGIGDLKVDRA